MLAPTTQSELVDDDRQLPFTHALDANYVSLVNVSLVLPNVAAFSAIFLPFIPWWFTERRTLDHPALTHALCDMPDVFGSYLCAVVSVDLVPP
jgi:hypothetical protein